MDSEVKNAGSDLLKNIVSTETGENDRAILGEAPELDTSLLMDLGPRKSSLLIVLKGLFALLFFLSMAAVLFFTSQLTVSLDFVTGRLDLPNISGELYSTNAEIISLQTDLNLSHYLQAKAAFDRFSSDGDGFLQLYEISISQTATEKEKKSAREDIKKARKNLKESFLKAQNQLSKNFSATLIDVHYSEATQLQALFEEKLRAKIGEKIAILSDSDDPQAKREQRNYQQTLALVGNSEVKNLMIQTDFEALQDEDVYDLVKKINSLIVNDLSAIQKIKSLRIKWSDIINEIDLRTMAIDSHFNENFYNDLGGIRYSSYTFDSATRKISLTGETKTIDTANFTMIADLVDEINQSRYFQNASMRSFSKSGSDEDGYKATLTLSFDLKDNSQNIK